MDEEPKSIWKKSFAGRTALVIWLAVAGFTIMLGSFIIALGNYNGPMSGRLLSLGLFAGAFLAVCWVLIYGVWPLLRWLFWKHWRRSLFALACFATLVALFYAEENWRGWHAWNQFKQEWMAKGEHFDLAGAAPVPVPADQNFALTPIGLTSYGQFLSRDGIRIPHESRDTNFVVRMRMPITHDNDPVPTNSIGDRSKERLTKLEGWQTYYRDLAARTNIFPIPAQPHSPAADVLLALGKYDPLVEELRAASSLPYSRFPLEYTNESPAGILLPHLAGLKNCTQLLQLRSLAELQDRQPENAFDDITLLIQLSDKIRTEPFLISHLVRIAMVQIALQPIWEGLAEHAWSDAQLAALEKQLANLDLLADYQLSMRGEMGCQGGEMDRLRRHPEQMQDLGSFNDGEGESNNPFLPGKLITRLIPTGWFYQNQLRAARMMVQYYIPLADVNRAMFSPELARRGETELKVETKSATPFNLLERLMLPALGNAARKFAWGQNAVDLARTALALERYRLAHGEFPETLDALAPQFIAKVPHDVIGGQPLKYRREANGQFILYSVGWNETDDGGIVVFKQGKTPTLDISQGDWVWRYPAR